MNKTEFKALIIPLSEKERQYQKNPELSLEFYQKYAAGHHGADGISTFDDMMSDYIIHGQLIPHQHENLLLQNIFFSKQTRFSIVPLHKHTFLEMNYVYSGNCTANINGEEIELKKGDVCIMDVGVVHTIYPIKKDDIVLNSLMNCSYFSHRFIERLSKSGTVAKFLASALSECTEHRQYLIFHTAQNPLLHELFEDVFCEYLEPKLCTNDVIDCYMTLIFLQLARCYQESKEKEYGYHSNNNITEVLGYIETHCTDCSLTSVAEHFNFHPNYLSRIIRTATGQSFKELVTLSRLHRAAFLLQNTNRTVSEIASQCGWSNQNQFYKKFNALYSCTPNEYRKSTYS